MKQFVIVCVYNWMDRRMAEKGTRRFFQVPNVSQTRDRPMDRSRFFGGEQVLTISLEIHL